MFVVTCLTFSIFLAVKTTGLIGWVAAILFLRSAIHPKVRKVYYRGLEAFPGHDIACRQMRGFGGMLAFELKGGVAAGKQMLKACDLCAVAVSLGDADTLIAHGTTMTHDDCSEELLKTIGITPDLIRMSIGIENKEDIIADLAQALDQVTAE